MVSVIIPRSFYIRSFNESEWLELYEGDVANCFFFFYNVFVYSKKNFNWITN